MRILILPDGSAIESEHVKAIIWNRSTTGQHGSPAIIRVYGIKPRDFLGFGSGGPLGLEQIHYCRMESDEAAQTACTELVAAWSGAPFVAKPAVSV
jgi:hypothetical protein